MVVAQLTANEVTGRTRQIIVVKGRIVDENEARIGVGDAGGQRVARGAQTHTLGGVPDEHDVGAGLHARVPRAIDVGEARDRERREGERLNVHVTDLVPELDVVQRDVPRDTVAERSAGAHLELPGLLRLELVQLAADLARRRQLEHQRRLVRPARVGEHLHRRRHLPDEAELRDEREEVHRVGLVAVAQEAVTDLADRVLRAAPYDRREGRHDIELVLRVGADVRRDVDLVFGQGPTMPAEVLEIRVDLACREVLQTDDEPVSVREQWRRHDVPELGAPVERGLIDDGKAQGMVEILVIELGFPFQDLGLAERRPERQAAAAILVVPFLTELDDARILLSRIAPELLQGEGAG